MIKVSHLVRSINQSGPFGQDLLIDLQFSLFQSTLPLLQASLIIIIKYPQ